MLDQVGAEMNLQIANYVEESTSSLWAVQLAYSGP